MTQPRHLNFNQFIEERAEQISKFRDVLKLDTKKKGHQGLPKSIRRRAMSHNRYRIPSKLRKINQQELIKAENLQRLPKSRKHIRKSHRLIHSYKLRHSKIQWLSNHLWAARRMRMIPYHGYKVAFQPNNKSFRSSYRHFRHNCCLVNLSYFQCLELKISANGQSLSKKVQIYYPNQQNEEFQTKCHHKFVKLSQLKPNMMYNGELFHQLDGTDSTNSNLICPLLVFNCGNFDGKILIRAFFHPCAKKEVQQLIQKGSEQYEAKVSTTKSELYCLIGPEWANKLNQALVKYGIIRSNIKAEPNLKFANHQINCFLSQKEDSKICQQKHSTQPMVSDSFSSKVTFKDLYDSKRQTQLIREKTLNMYNALFKSQLSGNQGQEHANILKFWSQFYDKIEPQNITFNITNRSKYTHRRKNKISKENKKKLLNLEKQKRKIIQEDDESLSQEQKEESLESIKNQIKQFYIDDCRKKPKLQQAQPGKYFEVDPLLVSGFRKSNYQGCYIMCSDKDNCRFWRILSHLNIKIIGLQQYKHIKLESQTRSFPEDYPTTRSFKAFSKQYAIKCFKKIKNRPPQKRINFLKINSQNPFSLIQTFTPSNSVSVFIEMVSKGRCFQASYIYSLEKQDIQLVGKEMQERNKVSIVSSQMVSSSNNNFLNYNQGLQKVCQALQSSKNQAKRRLIGRITSGGSLYSKCKQGGIGFIHTSELQQTGMEDSSENKTTLSQRFKNSGYVLIRKVSSPYYYLGQIIRKYH